MNTQYGQDSLQLYEYQKDSAGLDCSGNTADGAMCSPRLTVAKGGNVGIGVTTAAYRLDVSGEIHSTGWLRTEGATGWQSQAYGGGWYMRDTTWIRTYNDKGISTGNGVVSTEGGLTVGYSGAAPGAKNAIFAGNVGIGTTTPTQKLDVQGSIGAGNSDLYFTKSDHNYSGVGNTTGYAAIENAADHGTLMILGRAGTNVGRRVDVWDYLQVNGRLRSTTGLVVYMVNASCPNPGSLTTATTCSYCSLWDDSVLACYRYSTASNPVAGRLVDY